VEFAGSAAPAAIEHRTDGTSGATRSEADAPRATRPGALTAGRLAAFSTLSMAVCAMQVPLGVYVPAILAQYYGLPLTVLGVIFLVAKSWGVLADPLVGVLSDRTRNRFGRRRSWILAGGGVFGLATLLLFFPVTRLTPAYLGVVLFVFFLGWSMIQIPYFAWSGEVSAEYHERTRVATYQMVSGSIALPLVAWLGFDPHVAHNSSGALRGLLLTFALGPAIAHLLSALCVSGFKLDAAAHADIHRRLAERDAIAATAAPARANGSHRRDPMIAPLPRPSPAGRP